MKRVGVLALQGGYAAHLEAIRTLGLEACEVRNAEDLDTLDGLILPGGESTTQLKLIHRFELATSLSAFIASGRPVFATCAGMILSATKVTHPEQASFGWLDIDVERNGWGRQLDSFEAFADGTDLPLCFIRAPRITRVGPDVEIVATFHGEPVMVRQGNLTAATFHPEMTDDVRVHATVFASSNENAVIAFPCSTPESA